MDDKSAIIGFSQSEKIKAGLIWANQILEMIMGLPEADRNSAEKTAGALIGMVATEVHVIKKLSPDDRWKDVIQHMDKATIMMRSNVSQEAPFHLSKALTVVTSIGHETMTYLTQQQLL